MATRKNTPTVPASATGYVPSPGDVIDQSLAKASATLDLIYTALAYGDGKMFLEQLDAHTLAESVNSAILWIKEAQGARAVAHV